MEARTQPTQPSTTSTDPADQTDVRISRDAEDHADTTIKGDTVTLDESNTRRVNVSGTWRDTEDQHVREMIDDALANREQRENWRANKRNFNRMLTLFGALVIGLIVTFILYHPVMFHLPHWAMALAPYSFVITILMDSSLALYSYVKKY